MVRALLLNKYQIKLLKKFGILVSFMYSASSINRPGSTGRYIQLFSQKSTRFTVEKKLFRLAFKLFCG